jgi:uncharacterized protein YuzE
MATVKKASIHYIPEGDHLYIHLDPRQPAAVLETDYDFYIRYDRHNQHEIVGFECLDFSRFVPHIYDPAITPQLDLRFDVEGTPLHNASLQEILIWVYETHIRQAWAEKMAV